MLVNQIEIVCDGCGARIEPRQKSGGWKNMFTARAHVCESCWERELLRTLEGVDSWEGVTASIKENRFPAETFIGRVIEDDVVQRMMDKYNVSQT